MLTTERLLEVLPEINEIANEEWREACIGIWKEVFEESSWEDYMDAPNMPALPEVSLVKHTRGVYHGAFALAEVAKKMQKVTVDDDKLRVICLIHDICKAIETEKDEKGYHKSRIGNDFPHGFYSGFYAKKYNLPYEIVAAVTQHSQFVANCPDCIEGVIVFYADMADADICKFSHDSKPLLISYCKI